MWAYFPFYNITHRRVGFTGELGYPAEFVYNVSLPNLLSENQCHIQTHIKPKLPMLFQERGQLLLSSYLEVKPTHSSDWYVVVYKNRQHFLTNPWDEKHNITWHDVDKICRNMNESVPFLYFSERELQNVSNIMFHSFRRWTPTIVFTGHIRDKTVSTGLIFIKAALRFTLILNQSFIQTMSKQFVNLEIF